jgi:mono/diheme cytochrome c family protein
MKKNTLVFLVLGIFLLASCAGNNSAPQAVETLESVPTEYAGKTNPLSADAATAGAKIFQLNCEACHGASGHGDGPAGQVLEPRPKNLPELAKTAADDYIFWRISTGRPGTSMVPWDGILSDEQIWQVIAYIHTLR